MAKKKPLDFLDELDDPLLDPIRRLALQLLWYVRYSSLLNPSTRAPTDFDIEVDQLGNSLRCANNCGANTDELRVQLFCCDQCQQIATVVRYTRRKIAEGRIADPVFHEGLGPQLMHLPSGGYPRRDRLLSEEVREAVFKRDNYICQICGVKPADQIDHIQGSSGELSNLQASCRDCNLAKAASNLRPATPEEQDQIRKLYEGMASRIDAPIPLTACDDEDRWPKAQYKVRSMRRKTVKTLLAEIEDADDAGWEDVDGYVANAMAKDD